MKIAIPVEQKDLKTNVNVSFGRTPFFLFYDTDTGEGIFLDNKAAASAGGAGIEAAQMIVDNKADVLLTPRCGKNAADVFKAAEIKIYKTMDVSAQENINAFVDGKLPLLLDIHAGFHGHEGGDD